MTSYRTGPIFDGDTPLLLRAEYPLHKADLGEWRDDHDVAEAALHEAATPDVDRALGLRFSRRKRPKRALRVSLEYLTSLEDDGALEPNGCEVGPRDVAVFEAGIDDLPLEGVWPSYCKVGQHYVLVDVFLRVREGRPGGEAIHTPGVCGA